MFIDDIEIEDERVLTLGRLNVVVKTREGLFCINRFSPIGRSILFYGEHAHNEIAFCKQFIRTGDVVVDVGAHQGTHSVAFALLVGEAGSVYAFEPQRVMYQNLCASAALNSLANIYAYNNAVGEDESVVRIVAFDYAKRAHFSGMKISIANTGEEVQQITLDNAMKWAGSPRVDFLKIDVEGMEFSVLHGAQSLIESDKPVIYCEYHSGQENQKHARNVRMFFDRQGYVMFRHEPAGFNPENFYNYRDDRFNGGRDHNAVCIHRDRLAEFASATGGLEKIA